jgi:hypothetical protein
MAAAGLSQTGKNRSDSGYQAQHRLSELDRLLTHAESLNQRLPANERIDVTPIREKRRLVLLEVQQKELRESVQRFEQAYQRIMGGAQ